MNIFRLLITKQLLTRLYSTQRTLYLTQMVNRIYPLSLSKYKFTEQDQNQIKNIIVHSLEKNMTTYEELSFLELYYEFVNINRSIYYFYISEGYMFNEKRFQKNLYAFIEKRISDLFKKRFK